MKQPENIHAAKERFEKLVQNFDPKEYGKEHPLEPFIENIRILRKGGASYKTINAMLKQVGLEVCVTTVARFCQIRLLNPPKRRPQRKRKKQTAISTPKNTTMNTSGSASPSHPEEPQIAPKVAQDEPLKKTMRETSKKRRGPRIADPKKLL